MGSPRTTKYVLDVLMEREGSATPIGMIISRTGLTREQVLTAAQKLVAKKCGVERVLSGHAWVYKSAVEAPTVAPTPKRLTVVPKAVAERSGNRIFTEIGMASTGEVIVQDVEGNLYKAKKI